MDNFTINDAIKASGGVLCGEAEAGAQLLPLPVPHQEEAPGGQAHHRAAPPEAEGGALQGGEAPGQLPAGAPDPGAPDGHESFGSGSTRFGHD